MRANRSTSGFTLAEVLAALAFMAIVIPVAIEGIRIANLAGLVGQRKSAAVRIGERALNEAVATKQWQSGTRAGAVREGPLEYRWQLRSESWPEDALQLLTVQVTYVVQDQPYDIRLSTLVDPASQ